MHKQHSLLQFALECIDDCVLLLSEQTPNHGQKKRKSKTNHTHAYLADWKIQHANSRLLKMLGANSVEEIATCISDMDNFVKYAHIAVSQGYVEHVIGISQKKSGVSSLMVSFRSTNGFVCAIFRPNQDMHAETSITDTSARWHSIFDENSKLLCTIAEYHGDKKDFKLLWISWATANAFPEDVRKQLLGSFTQGELGMSMIDTQLWIDSCKKAEDTGRSVDFITNMTLPDGTVQTMCTTSTFLGRHDGVPAFCIIGRDISELVRTQRALESSQAELRTSNQSCNLWKEFFDSAPLAMGCQFCALYELTMAGVGELVGETDLRYIHANPECCQALKLPGDEIPGLCMSHSAPKEVVKEWMEHIHQAKETSDHYVEWEMKDGTAWFQVTGRVKDNLVLFIARDISERRMKQEQERAQTALLEKLVHEKTKDLQEALVVKTRFLGFMSHGMKEVIVLIVSEIRTPLTGLLGMLTLMQDQAINASQAESINTGNLNSKIALIVEARSCGEHLLTIINDILDFTKLGEKKVQLEKVPLSLQQIAETCVDTYASEACKKGVELICVLQPDQEDGFLGDPSRLSQVLLNMTSNAVKFCPEGTGEVVVTVRTHPWGSVDQYSILLSVRDNGIGISSEEKDKLFEPFVQADSSTSRKYGGTGLGLPICKHIAELMDGKIWFESEGLGKGSEFFFNVILHKDPNYKKPSIDFYSIQNHKVMIVAKNNSLVQMLSRKLSLWGFEVVSEVCCNKAINHVTNGMHTFHRVFVDSCEGPDCIMHLQKAHPVVVMGYSRLPQLPYLPFLKKPIRDSSLINHLTGKEYRNIPNQIDYGIRSVNKVWILLAEDNVVNQRVISQLLKKCGVTNLQIANNGEEAFQLANHEKFDMVLMDVMMPVMDGLTCAKKIREEISPDKQPRYIVALTADVCLETKVKCLECGMQDLITKPIDMGDLRRTLALCCSGVDGGDEQKCN